jgi:alcohol oxidase
MNFQAANLTTTFMKYINPDTGKRSDAAHGFVHPILDTQENLKLLLQSKAVRVLFEDNKAIGVEYVEKYVFMIPI